jgi:hypothetical protein
MRLDRAPPLVIGAARRLGGLGRLRPGEDHGGHYVLTGYPHPPHHQTGSLTISRFTPATTSIRVKTSSPRRTSRGLTLLMCLGCIRHQPEDGERAQTLHGLDIGTAQIVHCPSCNSATSCYLTPELQPGSPRRLRRRMTAMSMTATAAIASRTRRRPIGALIKYAQIAKAVQMTRPNTASHSRNVRALMAGAAPPIPDVGS